MNINKKVTLQRIQTLTELHGAPGFEEEVKKLYDSANGAVCR